MKGVAVVDERLADAISIRAVGGSFVGLFPLRRLRLSAGAEGLKRLACAGIRPATAVFLGHGFSFGDAG